MHNTMFYHSFSFKLLVKKVNETGSSDIKPNPVSFTHLAFVSEDYKQISVRN